MQEKNLCKKSHIIPKFLYRLISEKNNALVFVNKHGVHTRYSSEYEGGILCQNCDNVVLGKLDDYADRFIYGKFPSKINSRIEIRDGNEHLVVENDPNYDYSKYKLFWLSILWRSAISTRPFFDQIKLSDKTREDLRKMILTENAGEPREYAPLLLLPPLLDSGNGERGFNISLMQTMSPRMYQDANVLIYHFLIQGMTVYVVEPKHSRVNIEPSVEQKRVSFRLATFDEQLTAYREAVEMVRQHKKKT